MRIFVMIPVSCVTWKSLTNKKQRINNNKQKKKKKKKNLVILFMQYNRGICDSGTENYTSNTNPFICLFVLHVQRSVLILMSGYFVMPCLN